jgi:uncharacterized protein (AIM24 family)
MPADTASHSSYSVAGFLNRSLEQGRPGEPFENESERMLRIDIDGSIWLRPGAAVAYRGAIAFERLPTLDAESIPDALFRELTPLVKAAGKGRLYCGRHGSHVRIIRLAGETLVINWQELLAFEPSLRFKMRLVAHGVGIAAGGLATVTLSGHGALAVASHGEPLTMLVTPGNPVSTDPHATLAWSGNLTPSLKTDLSWRSVFRHGGHEPVQMLFEGDGFVVVQPYEDAGRFTLKVDPMHRLKTLIAG